MQNSYPVVACLFLYYSFDKQVLHTKWHFSKTQEVTKITTLYNAIRTFQRSPDRMFVPRRGQMAMIM